MSLASQLSFLESSTSTIDQINSNFVFTINSTERLRITPTGGIAFGGSANYGTSGQVLQSNGNSSPTWVNASGLSAGNTTYIISSDDRIKAPADDSSSAMRFGFTSFANNNTSPWADYLHLRSYTDASGGNDNLIMFRKDVIGMRIWQQTFNTTTSYSSFKDVAFTDSNISGSSAQVNTVAQPANASYFPTFVDANNASAAAESVFTTSSFVINPSTGNVGIGTSSPTAKLDVRSSDVAIQAREDGVSSTWRSRILSSNSSSDRAVFLGTYGTAPVIAAHNFALNAWASLFVNTTNGTTDGGNTIISGSGNVGIGTNSPTWKLHVQTTATGTDGIYVSSAVGGGNAFFRPNISTGANNAIVAQGDAGIIYSSSAGVGTGAFVIAPWNNTIGGVRLDSNGNVRVATTTSVSSAITGALQIVGGVGIGGGLFVGGTVTATSFVGAFSGAVTGAATQVNTVAQTGNATYYPTFVDANNASAAAESLFTTSSFVINPSTGNIGINATPSYKLDVGGPIGHTAGVIDTSGTGSALRILSPAGGSYATSTSTITGAIKIRLPNTVQGTMLKMTVKVYTYDGLSFDIHCGGYTYTGNTWYNTFAYMGTQSRGTLNVRFGHDGTYFCILIGEISTAWSYPQVFVTDFQGGFSSYAGTSWTGTFAITFETTLPTIAVTQVAYQPVTNNGGSWNINAATATNLSTNRTNWSTNGTISAVVGELAWKNYGNSHTIFDASAGTSPGGGAVNNTNAAVAWTGTYPTLMGWNGSTTYGVRVDSARVADSVSGPSTQVNTVAQTANASYYPTFVDANNASATAESVFTTSSFVINPGTGNVGIGITTPFNTTTDVLTVSRNQTAGTQIVVSNQTDNAASFAALSIQAYGGGAVFSVLRATPGSNPLVISTNGTERLRITAAGGFAFGGASNFGTAGQVLQSNGDAAPTWVSVTGLTAGNATTATNIAGGTAGQLHYQSAVGVTAFAGPGTAGQLLVSAGTNAPTYTNTASIYVGAASSSVNLFGGTAMSVHYQSAAGTTAFLAAGTAGQVLQTNGAGSAPSWVNLSNGLFARITSNTTVVTGARIVADTAGGAFTLTLPSLPATGANVEIVDGASWATNNLTIGRNGQTIEGAASDLVLNTGGGKVELVYDGTTWEVYSSSSGFTSTDDTTTNANHYPIIVTAAGGSTARTSSTKLYFNPSNGTMFATIFQALSDISQKTNIQPVVNPTSIVNQLSGVEFDWADTGDKSAGVIAQDLEQVLPHLVKTNDKGTKSVNYNGLIAYLIESVKQLDARVKQLENK